MSKNNLYSIAIMVFIHVDMLICNKINTMLKKSLLFF